MNYVNRGCNVSENTTYLIPRFSVSDVPIIAMARSILLQIFAAFNDDKKQPNRLTAHNKHHVDYCSFRIITP